MNQASAYRYLPPHAAEALGRIRIGVRRPVQGAQVGLHRSPHFGASVEFAEYRPYVPGDPPQIIDWSVYARSDRYVVRRFQEETNLRAFVLLDTSESLDYRAAGPQTKMEYALRVAAALTYILVRQGDAVGLFTFDSRVRAAFQPAGTWEGVRPLLLALEDVRAGGRSDIEAALHEVAGAIRSRSLVILVSDLLQDAGRIVRGLRHLHHDGHNLLALHVTDAAERMLGCDGVVEFRELETGDRLLVEIDQVRAAYRAAFDRHVEALRAGCAECMGGYHLMDTRVAAEEALSALAQRAAT